jgi:hypothetical protein
MDYWKTNFDFNQVDKFTESPVSCLFLTLSVQPRLLEPIRERYCSSELSKNKDLIKYCSCLKFSFTIRNPSQMKKQNIKMLLRSPYFQNLSQAHHFSKNKLKALKGSLVIGRDKTPS